MKRLVAVAVVLLTIPALAEATDGPEGSASSFATTSVVADARIQALCVKSVEKLESRFMTWAYSATIPFTSIFNPLVIFLR